MDKFSCNKRCPKRKDCMGKESPPEGYYYTTITSNDRKYKVVKECEERTFWNKKRDTYTRYIKGGFQADLFDYDVASYLGNKSAGNIPRLEKYLSLLDKKEVRSSILYFRGNPGTQKTTVATWLGREILFRGFSCKYIFMNKLILMLHKSNIDEEIRDALQPYIDCDILILDEAFTSKSQWGGYIDNFLKDKINKGQGIIFVSNYAPMMIKENGYGENIKDLVEREIIKRDSLFHWEDKFTANIGAVPGRLF
jgi:DNA replication protein DnaC